jgi:cell division protein FtsL
MTQRAAAISRTAATGNRRRGLLRLLLVGVLVVIGVGYVSPAVNFYTRSQEIGREQAAHEQLKARNDELNLERDRLNDMVYVEEVARKELGLVKAGEQPFIVKELDRDDGRVSVKVLDNEAAAEIDKIFSFFLRP